MKPIEYENIQEYRKIFGQTKLWMPLMKEIARRHALQSDSLSHTGEGTHIVFLAGDAVVIKLFCSLFPEDYEAESRFLELIDDFSPFDIPRLLHKGRISGYNYLVLSHIRGTSYEKLEPLLTKDEKIRAARDIGRLIERIRSVPATGMLDLCPDWKSFIEQQKKDCVLRQAQCGVSEKICNRIPDYLNEAEPLYEDDFYPVMLSADITAEHVFMTKIRGKRRVSGLLDFGDAMPGHPDYELAAPVMDIVCGNAEMLTALLQSAGYDLSRDKEKLQRRFMAYFLLHKFSNLSYAVKKNPEISGEALTLDEIAEKMWPLSG